jgi:hypothetical protein
VGHLGAVWRSARQPPVIRQGRQHHHRHPLGPLQPQTAGASRHCVRGPFAETGMCVQDSRHAQA